MNMRRLSPRRGPVVLTAIALLAVGTARAQTDDDAAESATFLGQGTSVILGGGPLVGPAYDGAKKEKVSAFPFIKIDGLFHDYVSVSTGRGIAVNLLGSGPLHAGFSVGFDGGRSASDDGRLRGTSDISFAASPGAFISYEYHALEFGLDVKERLGDHSGTEATLSSRYNFSPLPKLKFSIGPSVSFGDKKYNDAYFGVTESEAVRATGLGNPLHAYSAKAGIKDAGLSMTGFYQLGGHWSLGGVLGVSQLLGKDAESPLVQHRLQPEVGLGILYKF